MSLTVKSAPPKLNHHDWLILQQQLKKKCAFSKKAVAFLKDNFYLEKYKHRTHYLQSGETCPALAFILNGQCRAYLTKNNREYTYQFFTKHQWIVNRSYIQQTPSIGAIQIHGSTRLALIDRAHFKLFCQLFPEGRQLQALLYEQLASSQETHLINLLTLNAAERYHFLIEHQPELVHAFAGIHLSSFLDMRPESLSRIRRQQRGCFLEVR